MGIERKQVMVTLEEKPIQYKLTQNDFEPISAILPGVLNSIAQQAAANPLRGPVASEQIGYQLRWAA
jgi:hypothetical protein